MLRAGKQIRQVMPDQLAQKDVILAGASARGSLHQARQDARDLHHRHVLEQLRRFRAFPAARCRFSDLLSNCGNGCAGSIASGVSTGRTCVW